MTALKKVIIHKHCHGELVEPCRDIECLNPPFDELRVTEVTFYDFIKTLGGGKRK